MNGAPSRLSPKPFFHEYHIFYSSRKISNPLQIASEGVRKRQKASERQIVRSSERQNQNRQNVRSSESIPSEPSEPSEKPHNDAILLYGSDSDDVHYYTMENLTADASPKSYGVSRPKLHSSCESRWRLFACCQQQHGLDSDCRRVAGERLGTCRLRWTSAEDCERDYQPPTIQGMVWFQPDRLCSNLGRPSDDRGL